MKLEVRKADYVRHKLEKDSGPDGFFRRVNPLTALRHRRVQGDGRYAFARACGAHALSRR